jgi:uncharacterized protein (DUF1697 family)
MAVFVALLRAVNVGGAKVEMAALRRGLAGLGFEGVQTYVQSGNVVFGAARDEPREHADAIEDLITREFGLDAKVLVLTVAQMAGVAAANPFRGTGADQKALHVTFLFAPADEAAFAALKLPAQDGEQAALAGAQAALSGQAVYLHLPHGYGRTKLSNAYFERALRTPATTRNWRTVTTLVELSSAGT